MKNKRFILSAVMAIILLQACQKDTGSYPGTLEDKISHNTGTVTANLNGKPWVATVTRAYYSKKNKVGIAADYYINEDLHEALSIDKINPSLKYNGIHYSNPYTKGYEDSTLAIFSIKEHDANIAEYSVIPDTMANNYVEITSYNDVTHEITGKFQVSFYRTYAVESNVYDTVRFTNGSFKLKMSNR